MLNRILGLAVLAGGGWYLLRQSGESESNYTGAFGEAGIPYSSEQFDKINAKQEAQGLGGVLDLSFMDSLFPTQPTQTDNDKGGGILDIINGTGSIWDMSQPRGIRNNNPGNIEYTGTQWQGLDTPPSDGRFMRFVDPVYGIRAIARLLDTYANTHGLTTVNGIINRWAPTFENNTSAYARAVANALNVDVNEQIDVMGRRDELVAAITHHENGEQPYPWSLIEQGVALA